MTIQELRQLLVLLYQYTMDLDDRILLRRLYYRLDTFESRTEYSCFDIVSKEEFRPKTYTDHTVMRALMDENSFLRERITSLERTILDISVAHFKKFLIP